MKIAVAGGTGLIGRKLVDTLRADGVDTVVLARSTGVDLTTGAGLADALAGVDQVIDVTNPGSTDESAATAFFTSVADHLHKAGGRAGIDRLVVLSIVGIDKVPAGYYAAKLRQEAAAHAGPIPAPILRATQFHEFAGQVLDRGRQGGVSRVQRMRVQPVAAAAVARVLADLVQATDAPAISQVGGPREEDLVDMATRLAAARGEPTRVEADTSPGSAAIGEALLPGPDAALVGPTFTEWLDAGGR